MGREDATLRVPHRPDWPGAGTRAGAPHEYGDRHAAVYDRIYGPRFASRAAVDALARAAGDGRVLELGLGTGRLAIPLAARGVPVDGIEGSQAMVARLRSQPGGGAVGVFVTDLAGFELPFRGYTVAVCAVSTLFMLPGPGPQQRCISAAARHLRPGGQLIIEAFRPDPSRFDATGHRTEQRATIDGTAHQVRSRHDPAARAIHITHILTGDGESSTYEVTLCYATPEQIDAMATVAGLTLQARWHDWNASPATTASRDPISIYRNEPTDLSHAISRWQRG